jgi:hypothetical protein
MIGRHYFVVLLFLCLSPTLFSQTAQQLVSYAAPKEPLDIAKLADRSELIVVAEIIKLLDAPGEYFRDEESNKAKLYAAEVTVREMLKGNVPLGKIVVGGLMPITPTNRARGGPLAANTVRIFFLTREQNSWRFADPFFGALVAAPVTPRPREGSPMDKVMEQLLAALKSDLLSSEEKRDLISELSGSFDPRIMPVMKSELQKSEKSRDDLLTSSLLASLIRRNDADALAKAKQFVATTNSKYAGLLILAMAKLNRADLLPVIMSGLQSPIAGVRVVTADALTGSQLPEAEPLVLALLDDPNRHLVTQVMMSLASKYKQLNWAPDWDDDKRWEDMRQHWRTFLEDGQGKAGR